MRHKREVQYNKMMNFGVRQFLPERQFFEQNFVSLVWDRIVGDQGGPEDGAGLDDAGAVGFDLGEVLLEFETTATGKSEMQKRGQSANFYQPQRFLKDQF